MMLLKETFHLPSVSDDSIVRVRGFDFAAISNGSVMNPKTLSDEIALMNRLQVQDTCELLQKTNIDQQS